MPRVPRAPNPARLRRQALHHLERWPTTRANLSRVLMRKVWRASAHHEVDEAECRAWIDAVLDDLERLGMLDDRLYASDKARALLRRGQAPRQIRQTLRGKGVPGELIDEALAALTEQGDPEWRAAVTYARKRRLGAFGLPEGRSDRREKELARLARRGFSYDVARRVLDAELDELMAS